MIRGIKDGVYDDHEDEPCAENQKSEEKAIATLAEAQHERYELENPKVEELATQTLTGISEKQPGVETTDRLSDTQEQPAAESPTSKELQSMRDRVEELENELKSSKTREETTSKEIKDAAKMCIEECVTELVALQVQLAKKEKEKVSINTLKKFAMWSFIFIFCSRVVLKNKFRNALCIKRS